MNNKTILTAILFVLLSCNARVKNEAAKLPIEGTWKLLTGTLISKNDTVTTNYTKAQEFIKIINATHFAFLSHDVNKGKDSTTAVYSSGGGSYSLKDSSYTEHLAYCSDRQWEGNDFAFSITIHNDTLTQKGVEEIDSLGINRINIEQYVRIKN